MGECENSSTALQTRSSRSPAEHLRPYWFKPGQSGNPKGRTKRKSFETLVAEALDEKHPKTDRTKLDELAHRFVDALLEGKWRAIQLYLEREWPAPKVVKVKGDQDDPIIFEVRSALAKLPSERVEQLVEIGEALLQ